MLIEGGIGLSEKSERLIDKREKKLNSILTRIRFNES